MTQYLAKANSSLSFEVTKDDRLVGKLAYKNWFTFKAVIELTAPAAYEVEPQGFWGTTVDVKDGEKALLKFQLNWSGEIVIQTYFDESEQGYIFKHRGFFNQSFALVDREGVDLLLMKPHMKWASMNYEYQLTASEAFEGFQHKELLLLTAVHCANYYMSMMMMGGMQ